MRGRKCSNCNREDTPLWRKGFEGQVLCNSCGLYWAKHGTNPQKDEIVDTEPIMDNKVAKGLREKKFKAENDINTLDAQEIEESSSGRISKIQTGPASPSLATSQKLDVDLTKMTERQQIAYLLRESNGMEASPILKESPVLEKAEKTAKRSPILGAKRSPLEDLDEAWSSEEKPKRRKKDKPKKVEARNGHQTKPVRKQRKNEAICTFCEDGGNLLMCEGPCLRSFHVDCLGLKNPPSGRWECDDCAKDMSQCFSCKQKGEIGRELMKCKVHQCGKYYHYKCVSQFKLAKLINSKAKRFNCPLHYCATCEVSGDGKQSAHCFRCPTAYHVICMPSTAELLTDKSKETRKTGLILCPKHTNEPPLASREDPGASLLIAVEAEMGGTKGRGERDSEEGHGSGSIDIAASNKLHTHNHFGVDSGDSEGEYSEDGADSRKDILEVGRVDQDQKRLVDRAAEEVHLRHEQAVFGKDGTVHKHGTRLKQEADVPLVRSTNGKDAAVALLSSPACSSGVLPSLLTLNRHKDLDTVEREIMERFDREAQNKFGLDLGMLQPPKQRQKKMDRIHLLENKFREEIAHYKNDLVSMRDSMLARNQIDLESKVQILRSEHHRLDVETEETLSRKFVDWGERILEQKRNALNSAKLDSLAFSCNSSTANTLSPKTEDPSVVLSADSEESTSSLEAVVAAVDCAQGVVMHNSADINNLVSECMVSMSESMNL